MMWGIATSFVVFSLTVIFFHSKFSHCPVVCASGSSWVQKGVSTGVSLIHANTNSTGYIGISDAGLVGSTNGSSWSVISNFLNLSNLAASQNNSTIFVSAPAYSYYDNDIGDTVNVPASANLSTDSGVTWNSYESADGTSPVVAVSRNGTYALFGPINGCLKKISGGVATCLSSLGNLRWGTLAISDDGTKIIAGTNGGYIYLSTNSGTSWTTLSSLGSGSWYTSAISSDGTKMAVGLIGSYMFTSINTGGTWTEALASGQHFWSSIVSSSDGSIIFAGALSSGGLWLSTNFGNTWTKQNVADSNDSWQSTTMSSDGLTLATVNSNTNVWSAVVVLNTSPYDPINFGPANKVDGSISNVNQPNLTFTMTDPDDADSVKYRIKISTHSDFSSPVVDYTSALLAQGNSSFTVGQALAGGTYTAGSVGQTLASGSYYWGISVTDSSDSSTSFLAANSDSVAFVVDTIAPVISETTPVPAVVGTATPSYSFTSSEAGTISYTGDCTSTTTTATVGVNTITFSALSNGLHSNCKIIVTDSASNPSNQISVSSFYVDIDDPVLTEAVPVPTPINNHTPSYTFSVNEPVTLAYGGSCTSSTHSGVPGLNSVTFSSLADGTYSDCTIQATDQIGNHSNVLAVNTFTVDTTASTLFESTPVPTPTKNPTPSYLFTSTDSGTISYTGDCTSANTTAIAGTNTVVFTTLADGIHSNCRITVTNGVGLVSTPLVVTSFIVDTVAPTISEITAVSTYVATHTPTYTFTTNEPGIIVFSGDCTSTNTTALNGTNTILFSSLADGEHANCKISVIDSATNLSNEIIIHSFIVDTTLPVVTESAAIASPTSNFTPSYTFNASEAGTITYEDGCVSTTVDVTTGTNTVVFNTLAEGSYVDCTITLTDHAGNVSTPLRISSFVVDVEPIISLVNEVETPTTNRTPSFTFTSTKAGGISYGGICEGVTTDAVAGSNTVSFATLPVGTYASCTITVFDWATVASNTITLNTFEIKNPRNGGVGTGAVPVTRPQKVSVPIESTQPIKSNTVPSTGNTITTVPVVTPPHSGIFKTTLRLGDRNVDVLSLQKYLNEHGAIVAEIGSGSVGNETNYFGYATQKAVRVFQELHADEILKPIGLTQGTGYFGPATMKYVNTH